MQKCTHTVQVSCHWRPATLHIAFCSLSAGCCSRNVLVLHLPADKHVAHRMFIFTTVQLETMDVMQYDGAKCAYGERLKTSRLNLSLSLFFLLRCQCKALRTWMHPHAGAWAHARIGLSPARASTSGQPNGRISWGAVMCCFECLHPPVPGNSLKKYNLFATPAWSGAWRRKYEQYRREEDEGKWMKLGET